MSARPIVARFVAAGVSVIRRGIPISASSRVRSVPVCIASGVTMNPVKKHRVVLNASECLQLDSPSRNCLANELALAMERAENEGWSIPVDVDTCALTVVVLQGSASRCATIQVPAFRQ